MPVFSDPYFFRYAIHRGDTDALRITALKGNGHPQLWMKVGDSISAGGHYRLGLGRHLLFEPCWVYLAETWAWFNIDLGDCQTSWYRISLAAVASATAETVITPVTPASPLLQEWDYFGSTPRCPLFANVMFGTNDVAANDPETYQENMWAIVTWLTERGCIPILWTIPPRNDQAYYAERIVEHNIKLREIADAEGLPWVDYNSLMKKLPNDGLGADNVHPSFYPGHYGWGAGVLTYEGMDYGYNLRALLTLVVLDGLRLDLDLTTSCWR